MLFNSYLFIFAFLPIALLVFLILSKRKTIGAQLIWLAAWSCVFYAYWNPKYIIVLMASVVVNYVIAQKLMDNKNKLLFTTGILFNIAVIGYFKYTGFFLHNFNMLMSSNFSLHTLALPLGISFITFQKIAYLVDVYQGRVTERNFLRFLVFISFFPQLIAGPIVHYNPLMSQFSHSKPKKLRSENFAKGMTLFIIGLSKKVLIADSLASYADPAFSAAMASVHLTLIESWIGVLAYTFQIYFDFSGYSDMAIGLARMFGIRLPVNFNSPYKAANIIEFWRRWHITLSSFLRDYIYIPLGGNRKGETRKFVNLMATMLIGGLWHGANWTFVLWGGIHGGLLTINHLWQEFCQKMQWTFLKDLVIYRGISKTVTFISVALAWVYFRIPDRHAAKFIFQGLLGKNGYGMPVDSYLYHIDNRLIQMFKIPLTPSLSSLTTPLLLLIFIMSIVWLLPNSQQLIRYRFRWEGTPLFNFFMWKPRPLYLMGTIVLFYTCVIFMKTINFKPFLYFAF
jgi:alginate O-acetyltransferase complex protein AlgI